MSETMTAWRVDRLDPQSGAMSGPYRGGEAQPWGRVVADPCHRHPEPPPGPDWCRGCGMFAVETPALLLSSVPYAFDGRGDLWATLGRYTWAISRIRLEDPKHSPEGPNMLLPGLTVDRAGTYRGSAFTREATFVTVDDPGLHRAMTDAYRVPVTYIGRRHFPSDLPQLHRALGLPPPPCADCGKAWRHADACPHNLANPCPTCGRRWICAADCTHKRGAA